MTWTAAGRYNGTSITGYEAQYRKKGATARKPIAWTDYTIDERQPARTKTTSPSTRTSTCRTCKAGATYEVQVRARQVQP